jgi:hypothetical protein
VFWTDAACWRPNVSSKSKLTRYIGLGSEGYSTSGQRNFIGMSLNEQQFAAWVVASLDEHELPVHIAKRLMSARTRALEAAPGASLTNRNTLVLTRRSLVAVVGAFLLLLAAGVWYSNNISVIDQDFTDIDAAVLTGDLPVKAYLDRGFEAYVYQGLSTD